MKIAKLQLSKDRHRIAYDAVLTFVEQGTERSSVTITQFKHATDVLPWAKAEAAHNRADRLNLENNTGEIIPGWVHSL